MEQKAASAGTAGRYKPEMKFWCHTSWAISSFQFLSSYLFFFVSFSVSDEEEEEGELWAPTVFLLKNSNKVNDQ